MQMTMKYFTFEGYIVLTNSHSSLRLYLKILELDNRENYWRVNLMERLNEMVSNF